MAKTTRQRVLEFITSKEVVTAEEIGRILHMSAANARHHLGILLDEGVVQVLGELPPKGRGRPRQMYGLVQHRARHNLEALAAALLEGLKIRGEKGPEAGEGEMERLAARLAGADCKGEGNLSQRLYQAVRHLNQMNYRARWEARADSPRLHLGHCPYYNLLSQHPELCQMDAHLLEKLLGVPVRQEARLESSSPGVTQCIFMLQADK